MLAVGPGGLDKEGKRVQCSVAPGDKVLIPQVCYCFLRKINEAWKVARSSVPGEMLRVYR